MILATLSGNPIHHVWITNKYIQDTPLISVVKTRERASYLSLTSRYVMSVYPSVVMNASLFQAGRQISLMLMCDISLMVCGGCEQLVVPCWVDN